MEKGLAFDTCFLIDLQRELHGRRRDGPAQAFLAAHDDWIAHLCVVAFGEFAEGFHDLENPTLLETRRSFVLLEIDDETACIYAGLARTLRRTRQLTGANDLWIAASALRHGLPLVTNDDVHFGRVRDLTLMPYRTT